MSLPEYQELSQRCIQERNGTVHYKTIKELEDAVTHSAYAIKEYPLFKEQLRDQCQVIERFKDFKEAFPCNFI